MYALWNTHTGQWAVLPGDNCIRIFLTHPDADEALNKWLRAPKSVRIYAVMLQYDSNRPANPYEQFPSEKEE